MSVRSGWRARGCPRDGCGWDSCAASPVESAVLGAGAARATNGPAGGHARPRPCPRPHPHAVPPALPHLSPQWPEAQTAERPTWVTQKSKQGVWGGGRVGQATVGTRAAARPWTTGLPACSLLPEPHPRACVCADHTADPDTSPCPTPGPLLVLAPGTPQWCHQDLALLVGRCGQPQASFTNSMFGGCQGLDPQPLGQPLPHVPNHSPRQRWPLRQARSQRV